MPRNGKTIAQRLEALGFNAKDPDDRVHDLLDAYEARLAEAAKALAERDARITSLEEMYRRASQERLEAQTALVEHSRSTRELMLRTGRAIYCTDSPAPVEAVVDALLAGKEPP